MASLGFCDYLIYAKMQARNTVTQIRHCLAV